MTTSKILSPYNTSLLSPVCVVHCALAVLVYQISKTKAEI